MTRTRCSKCGKARRSSAGTGRRPPSTVKGQTSNRLNQKVWAIVGGKMKNVRFYRLVETVLYELKPDVRLLDVRSDGRADASGTLQGIGSDGTH